MWQSQQALRLAFPAGRSRFSSSPESGLFDLSYCERAVGSGKASQSAQAK